MKTKLVLPPPPKRRSLFKETLEKRPTPCMKRVPSKFTREIHRNLQIGDVVIVNDDNKTINCSILAQVVQTYQNENGLGRSVKL